MLTTILIVIGAIFVGFGTNWQVGTGVGFIAIVMLMHFNISISNLYMALLNNFVTLHKKMDE